MIRELRDPTAIELDTVRSLFREYAEWLAVDLCFQGFEAELIGLPGCYASPRGGLWLAEIQSQIVGCVAVRPLDAEVCELKRLWVRPGARGHGVGVELTTVALDFARQAGYRVMRLDTLDHMADALRLYRRLGFVECDPYYDNPLPGVVYLEKQLTGV